jgi:hypothetical protein
MRVAKRLVNRFSTSQTDGTGLSCYGRSPCSAMAGICYARLCRGPVAQLDRAMRFERRGWEFKSLRVRQSTPCPSARSGLPKSENTVFGLAGASTTFPVDDA